MKRETAFKLAFSCLCATVAIGLYVGLRGPDRAASLGDPGAYADRGPGYDPAAAPPGALAVDFQDNVDPASVEAIGRALGVRFRPSSAWTERDRVYVGEVDPAREAEALSALRADARVESAEEDFTMGIPEEAPGALTGRADEALPDEAAPARGSDFPNDPRADEQWHMRQIHMPAAWQSGAGEGVIVAVIDTGVSRVEDLAQTEFVPGWNFVANNDDADDDHGHGTHVAGTIAQSTHNGVGVTGIAFKAKIMPLKVLSAGGSGSVAGIAQAVRFAADHGAKVINMSLGGPMNAQVLAKAVRYAHDKGVVVVCAAGNDGRGKVSYPAANSGAVAVAATQQDEKTTFYSNWGKQVAIAAPGGNTREAPAGGVLQNTRYQGKDDYYFFMGTSMASPHVAGVAALVVAQGVADPDAVLAILRDTARPPAGQAEKPSDYASHYGAGIIDADAAVKKARTSTGALPAALGAALALGATLSLSRRRRLGDFGAGGVLGVVLGASGLFFLGAVPGVSRLASLPFASLLTHGFPAWDQLVFGAAGHGNPAFYSALVPALLLALFYGVKRARGLLAGFAFGVAGHLLAVALRPTVDIRFIPADALWLVVNAGVATLGGWLAARK